MSVFVKVVSMGKRSGHLILTVEPVSGYGTLRVDPNRVMMLSEEDLRRHELAEKTLRRDVEHADTLSTLGSLEPSGFVDRTAKGLKESREELWTKALPAMQELGAAKSPETMIRVSLGGADFSAGNVLTHDDPRLIQDGSAQRVHFTVELDSTRLASLRTPPRVPIYVLTRTVAPLPLR